MTTTPGPLVWDGFTLLLEAGKALSRDRWYDDSSSRERIARMLDDAEDTLRTAPDVGIIQAYLGVFLWEKLHGYADTFEWVHGYRDPHAEMKTRVISGLRVMANTCGNVENGATDLPHAFFVLQTAMRCP